MIILEIILFFLSIILLSVSIAGYGSILSKNTKSNFLNNVFLGYLMISLVVTFLHFFFSISFILSIFIFICGLIIFYKKNLNLNNLKLLKKINIFYLLILLLLIPMFFSQKYT